MQEKVIVSTYNPDNTQKKKAEALPKKSFRSSSLLRVYVRLRVGGSFRRKLRLQNPSLKENVSKKFGEFAIVIRAAKVKEPLNVTRIESYFPSGYSHVKRGFSPNGTPCCRKQRPDGALACGDEFRLLYCKRKVQLRSRRTYLRLEFNLNENLILKLGAVAMCLSPIA
ncbi:hypothetical protein CEXT_490641 [Caerostris extrusa]|uniref:Uncharacterized protein n=1 Tax=Caerostris extrusa TaxID=172846 RepID=A0AAV4XTU3_CAEEX|nr:hypothetical protein CEXT_490641 [Caerostris extrusa]